MQILQKHYKKILFFVVNILIIIGGVFLIKNASQKSQSVPSSAVVSNKNASAKTYSATVQNKQPYASSTTKVS